jgi:Transposase DDE domain group 1
VVPNLSGDPRGLYRGFDVERGEVPEQRFDALQNGLDGGRLSASSFRANAYRRLLHVVAYGLVVLCRAAAAAIAAVRRASVGTRRPRRWNVGAWVEVKRRARCLPVSATWPGRALWVRVQEAVAAFVGMLAPGRGGGGRGGRALLPGPGPAARRARRRRRCVLGGRGQLDSEVSSAGPAVPAVDQRGRPTLDGKCVSVKSHGAQSGVEEGRRRPGGLVQIQVTNLGR